MGAHVLTETVSSSIEIEAAPEAILGVLCEFEAYPGWARSIKAARVLERDTEGRALQVEFRVAPGPLREMRYVLRYTYPAAGLTWDYVEGDLKDIRGSYELHGADGRTQVTYHLAIDTGWPLPGFVKARGAREITRQALKELKRRVESRAG